MGRGHRFAIAAVFGLSVAWGAPLGASDLEHIEVHTEAWQAYTEKDGTGFAWDLIRAVYEPVGIDLRFSTVPYSRAVQDVLAARADAWVGSYDGEEPEAVYPDWHYDADRVEALFHKSKLASWSGRDSLANARVGWIRDYAYDAYMDVPVRKILLKNRQRALMLLKRGRLDYWLDAAYEQEHLLENAPASVDRSNFVRRHVLYKRLYLGFADTARGRELAEIWDRRFPQLLESGRVGEIYKSWDFEVWPFEAPRPS